MVHALQPRKPGKWNPYRTLCNRAYSWKKPYSGYPDKVECPGCRKRMDTLIKKLPVKIGDRVLTHGGTSAKVERLYRLQDGIWMADLGIPNSSLGGGFPVERLRPVKTH